jgi:hypothetical protein
MLEFECRRRLNSNGGSSPATHTTGTVTPVVGKYPPTKTEYFSYLLKGHGDLNLLHQSKANCLIGLSPPEGDGVNPAPSHEG